MMSIVFVDLPCPYTDDRLSRISSMYFLKKLLKHTPPGLNYAEEEINDA
jgi:hypothetical protein